MPEPLWAGLDHREGQVGMGDVSCRQARDRWLRQPAFETTIGLRATPRTARSDDVTWYLSRSQVSEMAHALDEQVEAFRTRPLDAGPYTFVAADALVLKV